MTHQVTNDGSKGINARASARVLARHLGHLNPDPPKHLGYYPPREPSPVLTLWGPPNFLNRVEKTAGGRQWSFLHHRVLFWRSQPRQPHNFPEPVRKPVEVSPTTCIYISSMCFGPRFAVLSLQLVLTFVPPQRCCQHR